jgi:hypothetical protein
MWPATLACLAQSQSGLRAHEVSIGPLLSCLNPSCALQALRVFDFYASLSAGDPFAMHIVAWGQLMMETNVSLYLWCYGRCLPPQPVRAFRMLQVVCLFVL